MNAKQMKDKIAELEKRIVELEARQPQVHYHTYNHYHTSPYLVPQQPFPVYPAFPQYPIVTC